jgi:chemotaxis methyl-accepting protein methylase
MENLDHVYFSGAEAISLLGRRSPPVSPVLLRPAAATEPPLNPFIAWLLDLSGLDARDYKTVPLHRRTAACLRRLRASSEEESRRRIERNPGLAAKALDALLIGVSGFFRDPSVFEALRTSVLPLLLADRRGLRVYSAGSSEGQELYSVAMLLAEAGALEDARLLGVDVRPWAAERAQAGWYGPEHMTDVGPERRAVHFQRENAGFLVRAGLRERAQWMTGDLASGLGAPGSWDLILFRNVSIYLSAERADRAWDDLHTGLAPGGVLMTGKAERPPERLGLRRLSAYLYMKESS